ncbi:MAG: tetratricopeptide repeat protein [Magnetococcales bacterium]|nr:tetratricopeptide repeat protein [Magnetococcales bacterium]
MAGYLNHFSGFIQTLFRMGLSAFNKLVAKFVIREKAEDAQDWKRRRAETLWKEAVEFQNAGQFTKAMEKWADSAKFESDSSSPRLDSLAHIYNEIGYCNYRNRNYPASKAFYEKALATYRKHSVVKDANTAYTLNNYALLLLEMGEGLRAERMIRDSLTILEKNVGTNSPLLAYVLNNMARAYIRLEKYEESEKILLRATEIESKMMVSESPEVVTTLELLAIVAFHLQHYQRAESLFLQVVKYRKEMKGEGHISVLSALFALGNFYSDTEDYQKAETIFSQCLSILEENFGPDHHFSGVFLNQLAWVAVKRGEMKQAREWVERSVAIVENVADKNRVDLGVTLYNRSVLACLNGEYQRAEADLFRAITLFCFSDEELFLPNVQYALALLWAETGAGSAAVFFGKCVVQDTINRLEKGLSKPTLPRWLIHPPGSESDFLGGLLKKLGRLKEAQAMEAKLHAHRNPVSTLHRKTSEYLQGMWGLTPQEKDWAKQYVAWMEKTRQEGKKAAAAKGDAEQASEQVEPPVLDVLIAEFSHMVQGFK